MPAKQGESKCTARSDFFSPHTWCDDRAVISFRRVNAASTPSTPSTFDYSMCGRVDIFLSNFEAAGFFSLGVVSPLFFPLASCLLVRSPNRLFRITFPYIHVATWLEMVSRPQKLDP